jgi:hypothetical protein
MQDEVVRLGLLNRIAYKKNPALLYLSFLLLLLATVNYYMFFDILAPSFPDGGSVRAYMGTAFLALVLVLTGVQVLFASGVLHLVIRSFYFERRDFLKAFFTASVLTTLYSVYYVLVPSWGPYTFLTGSFRGVDASTYLVLTGWTVLIILVTALVIRWIYGFEKGKIRWRTLLLISGILFSLVLAFAEG